MCVKITTARGTICPKSTIFDDKVVVTDESVRSYIIRMVIYKQNKNENEMSKETDNRK
jgi:hypothetical protein